MFELLMVHVVRNCFIISVLPHRFICVEVNDIEIVEDVISFNCVVDKPEYAYFVRKRRKKGKAIKHFKI